MIVWNQIKFFVTSITTLVNDVMLKTNKQTNKQTNKKNTHTHIQRSDAISLSKLQNIMCAPRMHTRLLGGVVVRCQYREWQTRDRTPLCPGLIYLSDLNIGAPVATRPGAWRDRISARTGWLSISVLLVREQIRSDSLMSQRANTYKCPCRSISKLLGH